MTQRIAQIKQPRGGYIKPKNLAVESLGDGVKALNLEENVNPSLMGTTVDYMARFMSGASAESAFKISLMGTRIASEESKALKLIEGIKSLDDDSIINALKLSGFDVCKRVGIAMYKSIDEISPDVSTIQNVRTMVERSLNFLDIYRPKVLDGFTFFSGYIDTVDSGDGDFTTADTLWDFKVVTQPVKSKHTLQLLMYWRMGLHSIHPEFQNIEYLGIYNPRMNEVHRIAVEDISEDVIVKVEREVIGYGV